MATYTPVTDFSTKDALPPGNAEKKILGADFDVEFVAIQTAVNSKANTTNTELLGSGTAEVLAIEDLDATDSFAIGGVAVTSTAAELNILDGVTATTAELNILDGVTATFTELNYVDGVTSAIQTQLDGKSATGHTHATTDITSGTFADAFITQSSVTQHEAAIDAGSVDGYDIVVDSGSPSGTDANTIYFVT